jgi:iron complex transport system substrate-binding protein
MIGLVEPWSQAQKAAVIESAQDLPLVPRITGKPSEVDIAHLRDQNPDLIVDYGDINPRYIELADRMQSAIGAPYVLLSGRLADAPSVIRNLGAALNRTKRAEEIAGPLEAALAGLAHTASLPAAARVQVYYARGAEGLNAVRAGSSLDEAIELAGGRNVLPPGQGALTAVTVEDVVKLKPDVVILADPNAALPTSPLRKALPASTRFLIDKETPFGWVERPPSLNRVIGALWLASRLYPESVSFSASDARTLTLTLFHKTPPIEAFEDAVH